MKISSASKKVLASALSAAMVVAFAPTVAFAADSTPTEADYIAAGATVKVTEATGSTNIELGTTGKKYYKSLSDAIADVNKDSGSGTWTVTLLKEQAATNVSLTAGNNVTIDLGGTTLTGDATAGDTIKAGEGVKSLTVKNGTVVAEKDGETVNAAVSAPQAATVALEGVTTSAPVSEVDSIDGGSYGEVEADEDDGLTVAGTVTTGAISGNVTAKGGAALTATASSAKEAVAEDKGAGVIAVDGSATAIDGDVSFTGLSKAKPASVAATASTTGAASEADAKDADAVAISGAVTMAEYATVTAKATATGADANATALGKAVVTSGAKGTLSATATAADGTATAIAGDYTEGAGIDTTAFAEGADAKASVAVSGKLTAAKGTYTGSFTDEGSVITGGKYTQKPSVDKTKYDVVDVDGTYWQVVQAAKFATGFAAGKTGDLGTGDQKTVTDFVDAYLEKVVAGKTAEGVTLAEGVKADDVVAKAAAGKLKVAYTTSAYNAKRATAEQKAAFEALQAYAKANLSTIEQGDAYTVLFHTISLQYTNDSGETVVMGTVSDLGTTVSNRETVDNKITLRDDAAVGTNSYIAYNGQASAAAFDKNDQGKDVNTLSVRAIPFATAVMATDQAALKDAIIKGDEPAAEKATQGIDVAKKSKTVKLAKKATKTKKAQSFSMGVSAETAVTTAKKSGSKYVTVKGGKVTLKKGVKKGTYTAKVTIKAAASDAYMAATKTVTVKFTVKK